MTKCLVNLWNARNVAIKRTGVLNYLRDLRSITPTANAKPVIEYGESEKLRNELSGLRSTRREIELGKAIRRQESPIALLSRCETLMNTKLIPRLLLKFLRRLAYRLILLRKYAYTKGEYQLRLKLDRW